MQTKKSQVLPICCVLLAFSLFVVSAPRLVLPAVASFAVASVAAFLRIAAPTLARHAAHVAAFYAARVFDPCTRSIRRDCRYVARSRQAGRWL
jgi:hypothetical protein